MKQIMKSILCLSLAVLMLLSLTACGGKSETAKNDQPEVSAEPTADDKLVYTASFQIYTIKLITCRIKLYHT